ncbi:hypothetical protein F4820DRAFT_436731 [Hypoxylon rubiginosum]|uniref:Uncharacterized protein n=1 Tax=Hypoxylon rubiginosum TaxID=110542 RepID=A0ACB9YN60_9PEZI|nr:hypothetical protein F4820DRAFT_436731 [Hypoxylon rubiginosum]
MAGSEVGFTFQTDVVNVSSLAHLITGRALKALSDGGVDFYAVIAVHVLGKNFVIRSSLEMTVHSHVVTMGRTGIQSVLAKALRIGWGHSGLAEDMTRTRAGTYALLLIGALSTGSTYFLAAQCLSELLCLHGCEADKLPNIDILKHMIGHLTPFVKDLGFSKILGHINATAMAVINGCGYGAEKIEQHLTGHGDALGLAGAINQLMLTSKKQETIYMPTHMRGAWLSTFASHILGMAVELRANDRIVWACAGGNGTAIFELGEHQAEEPQAKTVSHRRIVLVQPSGPARQRTVTVSYPISDAFTALITQLPMIHADLRGVIRRAICRLAKGVLRNMRVSGDLKINGHFNALEALRETLVVFGFEAALIDSTGYYDYKTNRTPVPLLGIKAMDDFENNLRLIPAILRRRVGCLIVGFAVAATALMQCRFDTLGLMICEDVLLASHPNKLRTSESTMTYIMSLTCNDDTDKFDEEQLKISKRGSAVMGLSGGNQTLHYTCLLRNDCYDVQGRFLSLSPGRASVTGVLRPVLIESRGELYHDGHEDSTLLSPGSTLEPHYIPSNTHIFLDVVLNEDAIVVQFAVGLNKSSIQGIAVTQCIMVMQKQVIECCSHDPGARFQVEKEHGITEVGGFGSVALRSSYDYREDRRRAHLFALHGNKLEQVIAFACLFERLTLDNEDSDNEEKDIGDCQFQLLACLKCCITRNANYSLMVVMGG